MDTPRVDLSMFKLTHAGMACSYSDTHLDPIKLPATLVSLQYSMWVNTGQDLSMYGGIDSLPQYIPGTLSHICFTGGVTSVGAESLPAAGVERITIAAEQYLWFMIWHDDKGLVQEDLFHKAQTVHLRTGEVLLIPHADESEVPDLDSLPHFFCPKTLNEAVLVTRSAFPVIRELTDRAPVWSWRLVMRTLIAARARLFAFEVSDAADEKRVAWRRWPPQGTPAHEAAARLHAEAVRWAGEMDD